MSNLPVPSNIDYTPIQDPNSQSFGKKLWSSFKSNPLPYLQGVGYGLDSMLSLNQETHQDVDYENRLRDTFQQQPVWDYNNMYGPNTNGGSQFQPIVRAEEGAVVRKSGSKAMPINIEGGELLMLPDGNLELAKGNKHKDGGINTILPSGTKVFSNKLKPDGSDKTFAQLAKKNDYTEEKKVLNNFYSHPTSKQSAELMMQRKLKALDALFEDQQIMNQNSNGEVISTEEMAKGGWIQKAVNPKHKGYCTPMTKSTCTPRRKALARTFKKHHGFHEDGGYVKFEEGGEYDLSKEQIQSLLDKGFELEYL